jgi:hypothetical protein
MFKKKEDQIQEILKFKILKFKILKFLKFLKFKKIFKIKMNSRMSKDSRKDIWIHNMSKDFEFLTRWATGDESPRDFVGVAVTAN